MLKLEITWEQAQGAKRRTQNLTVTWTLADLCSRWSKSRWWLDNQKDTAKLNFPERCARRKLSHLMKNIKARLAFGRGNVDKAQHFMVFGQMGLNSSAVALAPTPSAAFTTRFPVFQGIHWFKICHHRHTWNQTKLNVFTHYQLPSNGVYFLRNKHSSNVGMSVNSSYNCCIRASYTSRFKITHI